MDLQCIRGFSLGKLSNLSISGTRDVSSEMKTFSMKFRGKDFFNWPNCWVK